mgnify:CR=1 FL=1
MNILLSLDGVLSSDNGEPIRAGVQLYYALNAANRVAIITSRKKTDAEHWLMSHGIVNYDDLIDSSVGIEGENLKKRQILFSRSKVPYEMYVDSDPELCAWAFEKQNLVSLLFMPPAYMRVENRPDAPKNFRKWSEIEASINRVNISKSVEMQAPDLWQD